MYIMKHKRFGFFTINYEKHARTNSGNKKT